MNHVTIVVNFLFYASLAGLLGAVAMSLAMRLVTQTRWARGDMVVAVGSLLTRSRENARLVGLIMHLMSAVVFGVIYALLMMGLDLTRWPNALFVGAGFGVFHGLIVSLSLCWVVADQHPLEEFRNVGVSVAVSHFVGHVVFGAVVGLCIALSPL
jgi:uncharacterized membrane protein YagU involved in acid resistance